MKKSKILLLTYGCTVGGAENHILSLAKHLNKEKYDITLGYFYEKPDEARPMKDDFIKTGIKIIDFKGGSKYDFRYFLNYLKHIKKNRFDIIHTHLLRADFAGAIAKKLGYASILISSIHNTEEFMKNKVMKGIQKHSLSCADEVIVISKAVGQYLKETTKINENKLKTIYYGYTRKTDRLEVSENIKEKYNITKNELIIGMIGRYCQQKGHRYLIESFKKILKEVPEARLFIAGHGNNEYKKEIIELAKNLGVSEKIIFEGYRDDVINLMNQFDVFVLPSLWEGFGLVFLEAMSVAKPIVATDVGPISEVVINGETGYLVEPKNFDVLAEKIIILLKDIELRNKMGLSGKERLEKQFTIEKMISETEKVYDHWLNRKKSIEDEK